MHYHEVYKGNRILVLHNNDGKVPFAMGIRKARLVVENMDAVQAFVKEENDRQIHESQSKESCLACGSYNGTMEGAMGQRFFICKDCGCVTSKGKRGGEE